MLSRYVRKLRKATIILVMSFRPTGENWLPQDGVSVSEAFIIRTFINLVEEIHIRLKSGKSKMHTDVCLWLPALILRQ